MRAGSLVWTFCIFLSAIFSASASDTFVFRANSALQAAALMNDGKLHQLQLRGSPDLLLGDLAGSTFLAVAVEDTECLMMMGALPKVRLVAFQPNTIVAAVPSCSLQYRRVNALTSAIPAASSSGPRPALR